MLRRIFGPKRDKVLGEWRRLHNEELDVLYCSPNIFRVITSRRMRWEGNVACMGNRKGGAYRVLVGRLDGKRPLGRPKHERIILKCIFKKCDGEAWTGLSWLRVGTGGGRL